MPADRAFCQFMSSPEWQGTGTAFFRIRGAEIGDAAAVAEWTGAFNPEVCQRALEALSNGRCYRTLEEISADGFLGIESRADKSGARFSVLMQDRSCLLSVAYSESETFVGLDSRAGSLNDFADSLDSFCRELGLAKPESSFNVVPSILDFE